MLTAYAAQCDLGLIPPSGNIAVTGTTVRLEGPIPSGVVTITGLPPSVTFEGQISPSQAIATITGCQPSVGSSNTMVAGHGSFVGAAPSLDIGLAPSAGVIAQTGAAPEGDLGLSFYPASATLAITGTVYQTDLNMTFGAEAVHITGLAPRISYVKALVPKIAVFARRHQH